MLLYMKRMARRKCGCLIRYGFCPLIGLIFLFCNYYAVFHMASEKCQASNPVIPVPESQFIEEEVVWLRMNSVTSKHLLHVDNAFKAYNYKVLKRNNSQTMDEKEWGILWSHSYPFKSMKSYISRLKLPHCINHFPGIGFVTNKVLLATSNLSFIPKAFQMPQQITKLKAYSKLNPDKMFVKKSSDHRGIEIKKMEELDLNSEGTFIQEFMHNPLLINGYKFDIGVYVILTSVEPLRAYMYEGDVLFRFCPDKYHPFSADIPDKYVVGDDYLPTWKVPDLKDFYLKQHLGMKASFDAWMRSKNQKPEHIWNSVRQSIREVLYAKEDKIIRAISSFPSQIKFFEMMRFDFIISNDYKVYLMEANMSPNLSSAHFKENRLLYEQVMYNILSLSGINYKECSKTSIPDNERDMLAAMKDIVVFPEHCSMNCATQEDCSNVNCQLCGVCLSDEDIKDFKMAFSEHNWRGQCRRLIPEPIEQKVATVPTQNDDLSAANTLMTEWFRGKCLLDHTFCS